MNVKELEVALKRANVPERAYSIMGKPAKAEPLEQIPTQLQFW